MLINTEANVVAPPMGAHALKVVAGSIPIKVEKGSTPIVLCDDLSKARDRKVSLPKAAITITLFSESAGHDEYTVSLRPDRSKFAGSVMLVTWKPM